MWQMMHLNLLQNYPVAIYNSTDFILLVILYYLYELAYSFPCGSAGKEPSCNAWELGLIPGFDPWVGKIPWRRERLPTLVFWPGEFHGLYSPWGHKESETTEWLKNRKKNWDDTLLHSPSLREFSLRLLGAQITPCPLWAPAGLLFSAFGDFFVHMHWSVLSWWLEENSLQTLEFFFCAISFCPCLCLANSKCLDFSTVSP